MARSSPGCRPLGRMRDPRLYCGRSGIIACFPDGRRVIEAPLRERVAAAVQRGKVDCQLRWQSAAQQSVVLSLDTELAKRVVAAAAEVDALLRHPASISALEILRWPGVVQSAPPDVEQLAAAALALLDEALAELTATRAREGAKLQELIAQRCEAVAAEAAQARQRLPEVRVRFREKLAARLAEMKTELDPQRLEQEMVLLSQRLDVEEELDRLDAHLAEVRRVLGQGGAGGRRGGGRAGAGGRRRGGRGRGGRRGAGAGGAGAAGGGAARGAGGGK